MTDSNYNRLSTDNGNISKPDSYSIGTEVSQNGGYLSRKLSEPSELSESCNIEEGLDFLLSHFQEPLWPRNISTASTDGKQYCVEDRARALVFYNAAQRKDCRIAVFPKYDEIFKNLQTQETKAEPIPNHIFCDLDAKDFNNDINQLNAALKSTLRRMHKELNGAVPTVLWSGGGYHIHQPLDIPQAFEYIEEFKKYENVSVRFLRYAARRLTGDKSDPNHNVSFKSSMARVPGSKNTKYADEPEVKILQPWDGVRAKPSRQFVGSDFLITLVQKEIDKNVSNIKFNITNKIGCHSNSTTTPWIEKLLQTPIADYRRTARDLILIPYLIIRRGFGPKETYDIVMDWADRCSELRHLQPSRHVYETRVRTRIKEVVQHKIPPMTFSKFKEMQPDIAEKVSGKDINIGHNYFMTNNMSNVNVNENGNNHEFENEFDTQVPLQERRELSEEELSMMDIVKHNNSPTLILDFKKDKRIEAKHIFDREKGPAPVTYFSVTLPKDPDYERYYQVTAKKLRRNIIKRYLQKDKTRLEITRVGAGKNTVYKLRAVEDDKVLVIPTNDDEYFEQVPLQQQKL
jgi:hypothetical protein